MKLYPRICVEVICDTLHLSYTAHTSCDPCVAWKCHWTHAVIQISTRQAMYT